MQAENTAAQPKRRSAAPQRRVSLNRDHIAAVALRLIDETGVDGFSMRRLGAALGADPMAAYRHFADQQDLFDAVAATMFSELDMASLPWQEPWRELMRAYTHRLRSTLRRHPNAVPVFATRPVRSESALETGGWLVEHLQGAGFPAQVAAQLTQCLREYVLGHLLSSTIAAVRADHDATEDTAPADHFDIGVDAMLDGFARHLETPRRHH
ncbi:TetR family transcriptional regulator [Nocardia brasiliensis]|uniref:TetR family transcriptional regulator n=1 Tax=Nocardia brasiliensis TaxID=37326 RepID=A0A6G9Y035_NOCBR|nr:TetR/AcrR family transcriptional regulator C-terminal domain-containing protein [Nocardia brasiliensis]QIS06568.1 TetR family transcriptional regulator [Nocardia brasiliensis]